MELLSNIKPDYDTTFFERQKTSVQKHVQAAAEGRITKFVAADEGKIKMVMDIAQWVLGLLSIVMAFSFLQILFYYWYTGRNLDANDTSATSIVIGTIAAIVLLIIEVGKASTISISYKAYLYEKKVSKVTWVFIFFAIGFIILSFYTSISGSEIGITNKTRLKNEKNENAAKTELNSRVSDFKSQIASLDKDIEGKRKQQKDLRKKGSGYSWQGSLTEKGANLHSKIEEDITNLQNKKTILMETGNTSIDKMQSGLFQTIKNKAEESNEYAGMMFWVALINEIAILSVTLYRTNFDYRTDIQHNPELDPNQYGDNGDVIPFTPSKSKRDMAGSPQMQGNVIAQNNGVITRAGVDDEYEEGFEISTGDVQDMTIEMVDEELKSLDIGQIKANIKTADLSLKNIQKGINPKNRSPQTVEKRLELWLKKEQRYNNLVAQKVKLENLLSRRTA